MTDPIRRIERIKSVKKVEDQSSLALQELLRSPSLKSAALTLPRRPVAEVADTKDDASDVDSFDVAGLPPGAVAGLGDSALGHAIRRLLAHGGTDLAQGQADPIAAHDSHV